MLLRVVDGRCLGEWGFGGSGLGGGVALACVFVVVGLSGDHVGLQVGLFGAEGG